MNRATVSRSICRGTLGLRSCLLVALLPWGVPVLRGGRLDAAEERPHSYRLPPDVPPEIGAWFWKPEEFVPEGYRKYLDMVAEHSPFGLLTTSQRVPREITEPEVHDQYKAAVAYAQQRGIRIALDLDIRLAREAFRKAHPDELQEMLRIKETALDETADATITITKVENADHMTWGSKAAYVSLAGRLVRVYSYVRGKEGVEPESVKDITEACKVQEASAARVVVNVPGSKDAIGRKAAVMAAFTLFCADVFAPHLMEFQRAIFRQYEDVPLSGAMKDEWGFPTGPAHVGNDFYISTYRADAYAKRTGGRELTRDCLLMFADEHGRKADRQAAINHFQEMNWQRNGEIEEAFYRDAKATYGAAAFVGTHATWHPALNVPELNKNGWDWWVATRDYGQSDEITPYPVRTSLARKWGGAVWYNQYYAPRKSLATYTQELWRNAASGGRVNYHPLFPHNASDPWESTALLLQDGLMRGECRVRLLNFISKAQLDCPVAVVFGHAAAMNWAGSAFLDNGVALAQQFWSAGYPADLIPSSEIRSGALTVSDDGFVQYGAAKHKYAAVILHQPEFERPGTAEFWKRAAAGGKTALYRNGNWTADFDGKAYDGNAALPREMADKTSAQQVIERLKQAGIEPSLQWGGKGLSGRCRLVDGTEIAVAATPEKAAGEPIKQTLTVRGQTVTFDAIGLAAVRVSGAGDLEAMAAGGLKSFAAGKVQIELAEPADIALWRDEKGNWRGVLQGHEGPVAEALLFLTREWLRLDVPRPWARDSGAAR
ncbi:MAG: hypothetical protein NTW87_19190 [Planctomycetota bacterium]|nr:hypothetical protein [Planctomycetota bacterium]